MNRPTDADLVAYLDGELGADQRAWMADWLARDSELRNRLLLLQSGGRPFRQAFETLLEEAPRGRLAAMVAALPSPRSAVIGRRRMSWTWLRPGLLATGVALFVAGIGLDHMLPQLREALGVTESEDDDEWRQTVAEYVALYTSDTFAGIPQDAALSESQLAMLGSKLDVSLSLAQASLPGVTLKWVQLLEYDGKPLGQLAYLDGQGKPMALCIYADGRPDTVQTTEQRAGLNIVHWASHGHAFMVLGHAAMPQLQSLAVGFSHELMP